MNKGQTGFAALVGVCAALIFFAVACGGGTPASPTRARPSVDVPASLTSPVFGGTTTSWVCFTASSAGVLAAGGCPGSIRIGGERLHALAGTPSAPTALQVTVADTTVTLTWQYISGLNPNASSFQIEAGSASGLSDIASFDTGNNQTTLTVTNVPSGSYFVRVRARGSDRTLGPASNEVIVTVTGPVSCTATPSAPTGLSGSVNGTTVTLSWTAPSGVCLAASYVLRAGASSGSSNLANFNTGSAATSYTATSVPAGTYFVRVLSANANGTSAASNEVIVTVGGSSSGVAGRWVGLVANGDGLSSRNTEKWDLQFDLTQTGNTVNGTYSQTGVIVESNGVIGPCAPSCRTDTIPMSGTVGSGTFSFNAVTSRGSLILNGTFTASRMTGTSSTTFNGDTGTFALNKQ